MGYLGPFLIVIFSATLCMAEGRKASGAAKRRHDIKPSPVDIEDVIRAEQDPDFATYLKERENRKREEKAVQLQIERQRKAEAAAYEKARLEYSQKESKTPVWDEAKEEEKHLREQQAWEEQQEKLRREEVKRAEQQEMERMARFEKALPQLQQRMPASKKPNTSY